MMPKVVSEYEKEMIREAMYINGVELIKQKGVKRVTVEDIARAVNIAKGSFYAYYNSKEELLYAVIKKSEKKLFDRVIAVQLDKGNAKEGLVRVLKEIYLAPDSLALYVKPSDMEYLFRKLPSAVEEWEQAKANDYFSQTLAAFRIRESHCDFKVLAYLMDSLQFIASLDNYNGGESKEQALNIMVDSIAVYMSQGIEG
ncbi:AcrR family transcriptional regulator [Paenibacillus anaericanus]|uniref:TetR/AcrR family transcriptional regulator n=1 Tax=Paenibacillus anaericanus TaxID=170367 RepID=UPI002782D9DD|nr:TetR/AcrR family transcriptional regulator [Paenibacillus anaericanus]MDQ0091425.1 AcrR family transcriptional regulator [Paenibacillus anaericanus]